MPLCRKFSEATLAARLRHLRARSKLLGKEVDALIQSSKRRLEEGSDIFLVAETVTRAGNFMLDKEKVDLEIEKLQNLKANRAQKTRETGVETGVETGEVEAEVENEDGKSEDGEEAEEAEDGEETEDEGWVPSAKKEDKDESEYEAEAEYEAGESEDGESEDGESEAEEFRKVKHGAKKSEGDSGEETQLLSDDSVDIVNGSQVDP